jgi:predicted nuclease of predicted toxin-antitoxin system
MRVLLDEGLPARAAALLREDGIDAVHATEVEALSTPDERILELARSTARVVVTLDADFHALLAASRRAPKRA